MNVKTIWVRFCGLFQVRQIALLQMMLVLASCTSYFGGGLSNLLIDIRWELPDGTTGTSNQLPPATVGAYYTLDFHLFDVDPLPPNCIGGTNSGYSSMVQVIEDVGLNQNSNANRVSGNRLSGTPTTTGRVNVTSSFKSNANAPTGCVDEFQKSFLLLINPLTPPLITTTSLPEATIGMPYDVTLQATGGVTPLTWSLESGSGMLPPGLTLSNAGVISGSPTAAGTYDISVQVSDSSTTPQTATRALTIVVNATPPPGLLITTVTLPNGVVNLSYNATVAAQGGLPPYTWAVSAGSLPPGLALLVTLGDIAGLPSQAGTYNFTLQAVDVDLPPQQTTRDFSIVIENPVPTAVSLTPNQALAGGITFGMDVSGTGFVSGSEVLWNGTALATTFNSSIELRALVFNSDIASPGSAQVTVRNPAPGGGTSNALTFTILNPLPVLSVILPDTANAGTAGFTITATGSDFIPSSIVEWSGNAKATTFVNSTELRAQISALDIQAAANVPVTVLTPAPGGGRSAALNFMVNPAAPPPPGVGAGVTERISVSSSGLTSNGASGITNGGDTLDISENGDVVAFQSDGSNLDPNYPYAGVFVRRVSTGFTRQLARGWQGATPDNFSGESVAISGNGSWVAFESRANNLLPDDTYPGNEIFVVHSCVMFAPVPVICPEPEIGSLANTGLQPTAGGSTQPDLSFDGSRLVFSSNSELIFGSGTIGGGSFGKNHIWLRDRSSNTTELISVNDNGELAQGNNFHPRISRNGRFVVFSSDAYNLNAVSTSQRQIYVRDTCSGGAGSCTPTTTIVSVNNAGDPQSGGGFSVKSDISDDGRYVVFDSNAPNLVPGNNTNIAVYMHDRLTGNTTSIVCTVGSNCSGPSISGDGRFVSYDNGRHVFVYDTCIGVGGSCVPNSFVISRQIGAAFGNNISDYARISEDGFYVTFGSFATNLVLTGNNGLKQVYRAKTR